MCTDSCEQGDRMSSALPRSSCYCGVPMTGALMIACFCCANLRNHNGRTRERQPRCDPATYVSSANQRLQNKGGPAARKGAPRPTGVFGKKGNRASGGRDRPTTMGLASATVAMTGWSSGGLASGCFTLIQNPGSGDIKTVMASGRLAYRVVE